MTCHEIMHVIDPVAPTLHAQARPVTPTPVIDPAALTVQVATPAVFAAPVPLSAHSERATEQDVDASLAHLDSLAILWKFAYCGMQIAANNATIARTIISSIKV